MVFHQEAMSMNKKLSSEHLALGFEDTNVFCMYKLLDRMVQELKYYLGLLRLTVTILLTPWYDMVDSVDLFTCLLG